MQYTLEQLEGELSNPCHLQSGLIERCVQARKKKIKDLSLEDIRTLLCQSVGLNYIVPLALSFLEDDPLCSGGLYKGDLLAALINIPDEFWRHNPDLNNRLVEIQILVKEIHQTLSEEIFPKLASFKFI